MPMFKKKPVIIEARLFMYENDYDIANWCDGVLHDTGTDTENLTIGTLEGIMTANIGDYVIKGIKGEFYPCKPDIFLASYEALDEVGTIEPTRIDHAETT